MLSYAEHGRSRAIAQERTHPPFRRGKKGTEAALKLMASAFAAFVFRNVLRLSGPRVVNKRKQSRVRGILD